MAKETETNAKTAEEEQQDLEDQTDDQSQEEETTSKETKKEPEEEESGPKTLDEAMAVIRKQEKALRKANKEAASRRIQLENEKKKKADEEEEETKTSHELEQRLAKAQEDLRKEKVRNAVYAEASRQKFRNPEDAYRLIDMDEIDVDEDGKVTGVKDALKDLVADRPYLIDKERKVSDIDSTKSGKQPEVSPEELATRKRGQLDYSSL